MYLTETNFNILKFAFFQHFLTPELIRQSAFKNVEALFDLAHID
jgi:hypothetical protein